MMICTIERKAYKPAGLSVSMIEPDLSAGLRSLRNSLRQIKALLAWEQLQHAETRPGQPPSFTLNDFIERDLRNEFSFFLSVSVQMHSILNDKTLAVQVPERQTIKRQLSKIEQEAYGLNLHPRLCRC